LFFDFRPRALRGRWAANIHAVGSDLPDVPVPAEVERLADADAIRQCLAELPADHAEALTLHHVWGFSFDEIAGMLGVSAVAARARASRGSLAPSPWLGAVAVAALSRQGSQAAVVRHWWSPPRAGNRE
jgi:DNA-directed RNA polymerase specialized sigma24 family protein